MFRVVILGICCFMVLLLRLFSWLVTVQGEQLWTFCCWIKEECGKCHALCPLLRAQYIIIEGVFRRSGLSATIRPSFFRISHAQMAGVSNSVLPYCVLISVSDVFGQFMRRLKIPDYPQVQLSSILFQKK